MKSAAKVPVKSLLTHTRGGRRRPSQVVRAAEKTVELSTLEEAEMVHEDCLGEGETEWTSEFKPTGSSSFVPDGKIEIKEVSNTLKGKHKKGGNETNLETLVCDGQTISFNRLETRNGSKVRVFYENGRITKEPPKVKIKGTFREVNETNPNTSPAKQSGESAEGSSALMVGDGDWQAEKPGGA